MQSDSSTDPDVRVHVVLKRNPNPKKPAKQSEEHTESSINLQYDEEEKNQPTHSKQDDEPKLKPQISSKPQERNNITTTSEEGLVDHPIPKGPSPSPVRNSGESKEAIVSDAKPRSPKKSYIDDNDEPLDDFTYDADTF